jgi:hypothetical protein
MPSVLPSGVRTRLLATIVLRDQMAPWRALKADRGRDQDDGDDGGGDGV